MKHCLLNTGYPLNGSISLVILYSQYPSLISIDAALIYRFQLDSCLKILVFLFFFQFQIIFSWSFINSGSHC